jgi:phage terminase small subunit
MPVKSTKMTRAIDYVATLTPTRRLNKAERTVFDRVNAEFIHLTPSDAEQLTSYAEAVVRYEVAVKETKKHPTIAIPVVNRTTGNVTGERITRNPAFATMREAMAQMVSLGRRLLIDAHSADKRQRLLTKKSRAMTAAEAKHAADGSAVAELDEGTIQTKMDELRKSLIAASDDVLRLEAIWYLTVYLPSCNDTDLDVQQQIH